MLHAKAKWNITAADDEQVDRMAQALQIDPLLARLLIARGMTSIEQARTFLDEGTDCNYDPFLLNGMEKAVARIRLALEQGEKIRIYGDYDADGVSSTVLMIHLLKQLQANFDYYIPHRIHEGYGLNNKALDLAQQQGVQLIITVDTGISAVEEIAHARQLGLDVIVTDHHEPPKRLPEDCILINPKQPGCTYPFKELAGVGVAFKLAQALLSRWPEELLEFATIGTIADLMPLLDENRVIVKQGLRRMQASSNLGIRALFDVAGINLKDINSTHIGFTLAPRINASGRLDHADEAVRLLTTDSQQDAELIAHGLDQLNKERQRIVEEMTKQAHDIVLSKQSESLKQVLVIAQEDWNAGVVGIVASKLVDKYYRPTLVLSMDKATGISKGSARSITGYDLYQALSHCHELLDHYGGHQAAAGLTLASEHVPELERRLNALAAEWLCLEDFTPYMDVDMVCSLEEIGVTTVQQLELLGPFGMGNPTPKVIISNASCKQLRSMGKEQQHMKMTLRTSMEETAATLDAVGFHKSGLLPWISPTASMDVLGELSINEWNGIRKPQVMIQDLRIVHTQLFDWRGVAQLEPKLAELAERVDGRNSSSAARAAVLMFHSHNDSNLGPYMNRFPVWLLNEHGNSLLPVNELASQSTLSLMTDIILLDLPRNLSGLSAAVALAVGMERIYTIFYQGGTVYEGALPSRDMFKTVYAAVQQQTAASVSTAAFITNLSKRSGLSASLIQFMLDVFTELGLLVRSAGSYKLVTNPVKKELTQSQSYQNRQQRVEVEQALLYASTQELHEWLLAHRQANKLVLEAMI